MKVIADTVGCSQHKVAYWMNIHNIKKRSISDAIYIKNNPAGDPFTFKRPTTKEDWMLYGLGLGLYWGEGTKANQYSIRLGNTDPQLIINFIKFLQKIYGVDKSKLKFGLQIFTDIDVKTALLYWQKKLSVNPGQFYKPTISISVSKGTYKRRSQYGVLTIFFHNKKLRDILMKQLAAVAQW